MEHGILVTNMYNKYRSVVWTFCKQNWYQNIKLVHKLKFLIFQAVSRETEILAEDEQAFLARQQQYLLAGGALTPSGTRLGESPMRAAALGKGPQRSPATPGMQVSPRKVCVLLVIITLLQEKLQLNYNEVIRIFVY